MASLSATSLFSSLMYGIKTGSKGALRRVTVRTSIKIHSDLFDVQARLQTLGLKVSDLLDSARGAFHGREMCTELDPPMYAALSLWAHGVRRLRQRLLPLSWSFSNEGGYSTAVSPDGRYAIAVASGDVNTGNVHASPTTLSAKGPRTEEAISANQLSLDLRPSGEDEAAVGANQCETWLLLIQVDNEKSEIRAELSLPSGQDDQGRVTTWAERIIFGSIDFDKTLPGEPGDDLPDIDIEIKRRA